MTVCRKGWKNDETVFPPFPQTLEIDVADFHITTATTTTGKSNNDKRKGKQVPTTIGNYGCR
jgi:hypothetical protein